MPQASLQTKARVGAGLILLFGQRISEAKFGKLAMYMQYVYGISPARLRDILQELNRDAANIVSNWNKKLTELREVTQFADDTHSLDPAGTQTTLVNDVGSDGNADSDDRPRSKKRKGVPSSSRSAGKRRCDRLTPSKEPLLIEPQRLESSSSSVQRQPGIYVEIPPKSRTPKNRPTAEGPEIFDLPPTRESSPATTPSHKYAKMSGALGQEQVERTPHPLAGTDTTSRTSAVAGRRGNERSTDAIHDARMTPVSASPTSSATGQGRAMPRGGLQKRTDKDDNLKEDGHNLKRSQGSPARRNRRSVDASEDLFEPTYRVDEERQLLFDDDNNIIFDGTNLDGPDQDEQVQFSPYFSRAGVGGRSGSESTEDDAAADQLRSEAFAQRQRPRSATVPSSSSQQVRQGSRSDPVEIKSESDSDRPLSRVGGDRAGKLATREKSLKKQTKSSKQRETVSGSATNIARGERSLQSARPPKQALSIAASTRRGNTAPPQSPGTPKQSKVQRKKRNTPQADKVRTGVKKERKEKNLARIPKNSGLGSSYMPSASRSSQVIPAASALPSSTQTGPRPGSNAAVHPRNVDVQAALRREREVRSSAPAPAFMTRNLGLTASPRCCGDGLVIDLTQDDSLADDEEQAIQPVGHEPTLTSSSNRQDPTPPSPPAQLLTLQPAPLREGPRPCRRRDDPDNDTMGPGIVQANQNNMLGTIPPAQAQRVQPTCEPPQAQSAQPQQLPVTTSSWRRRSWSRHSRSPSGESSYNLWGLFRMRTTWDDEDNTAVETDSELEIVGVPRPRRWGPLPTTRSRGKP
ncbi:hypothetical protein HRR80_007637 [Exophiala dermatitidis]|uniref:Uncharacterized protein n=2 Tax=Exophiala dermatitidis TaxID=5970 RepID=A0AAN6EMS9_EXODE|nr:hypothetical protein HRR75_005698 [Exophiala dermatitidis]KAJ4538038.1 hypothetical protein HRR77_007078 [Exophiala dermatitidis]KAJ4539769.1 hypothetical protein HRR76_003205 [Exophiala dermatitidis]KAJ4547120.1 hypothetical protein HRR78_005218 [Exophiala dermatitidis]KAJ4577400.1 hypothetical protein HRR82_005273 [Exophiala dermatitidis]